MIDILITAAACVIIAGIITISVIVTIRAHQMKLRGYVALLSIMTTLLAIILIEIIIKGGIHL